MRMKTVSFFTDFITVSSNPLYDYIISAFLLAVSGTLAYKIGGELGFEGKWGKIAWIILAIIVYAILAAIVQGVIWLISLPWWIWLIIGVAVVCVIIATILIKRKMVKPNE